MTTGAVSKHHSYSAIGLMIICPQCEHGQVPDVHSKRDEKVDAVVLDEDSVGAPDEKGDGAKILRGEGALDLFLGNQKRQSKVRSVAGFHGQSIAARTIAKWQQNRSWSRL